MNRVLLFEYASAEAGTLSMHREADGTVTLTMRSAADALSGPVTFKPPISVLAALGDAARVETLRHKRAGRVGD